MSTIKESQVFYQEERILLAIQTLKKDQILSICVVVRLYRISHITLIDQLHDCLTQKDSQSKNQKLISIKKSVLIQ